MLWVFLFSVLVLDEIFHFNQDKSILFLNHEDVQQLGFSR